MASSLARQNTKNISAVLSGETAYADIYRTANVTGYSSRRMTADIAVGRVCESAIPAYDLRVIDMTRQNSRHLEPLNGYLRHMPGGTWSAHSDYYGDDRHWLGYFESVAAACTAITQPLNYRWIA